MLPILDNNAAVLILQAAADCFILIDAIINSILPTDGNQT